MADLREFAVSCGAESAQTYIQSGNLVISHPDYSAAWETALKQRINAAYGFAPEIMVFTNRKWRDAVTKVPFSPDDPKNLYLYFFTKTPEDAVSAKILELAQPDEEFVIGSGVAYLFAPQGFSRSKLAQNVERVLGVPATARNWRSVNKIADLLPNPR